MGRSGTVSFENRQSTLRRRQLRALLPHLEDLRSSAGDLLDVPWLAHACCRTVQPHPIEGKCREVSPGEITDRGERDADRDANKVARLDVDHTVLGGQHTVTGDLILDLIRVAVSYVDEARGAPVVDHSDASEVVTPDPTGLGRARVVTRPILVQPDDGQPVVVRVRVF